MNSGVHFVLHSRLILTTRKRPPMRSTVNAVVSMAALLFTGNTLVACGPSESGESTVVDTSRQSASLSGGTWQGSSFEDCYAMYGASCYTKQWTPSCFSYTGSYANPQGTPCANISDSCWFVKDSRWVIEYECR